MRGGGEIEQEAKGDVSGLGGGGVGRRGRSGLDGPSLTPKSAFSFFYYTLSLPLPFK